MMFKEFGGANEKLISEYEDLIQMKLPNDYKKFLLKTNGGSFENIPHLFKINGISEEIGLDVLFGFQHARSLNLESWFKEYQYELMENKIIIGNTMGAGLILLVWEDGLKGIFLWDHAIVLEESTEEDCVYKIADDFKSFLDLLV